jgi:tryptophanyl-tRNA synthetase
MAISEIEKKFSKISNYGEFKNELTNVVINWFEKFNVSFNKAQQQYDVLEKIINNNAKKCQEIAGKKVKEVYKKIGLSY